MNPAGVYAFEAIDPATLPFMPLSARRALDVLGRRLSLDGWSSLPIDDRRALAEAGSDDQVDPRAMAIIGRASPVAATIGTQRDPDPFTPPADLAAALGPSRPIDRARWRALPALARYALCKYASKPEKLALAYDEIMGAAPPFTHLGPTGEARMVDVGGKPESARRAVASARLCATPATIASIPSGTAAKGDVLAAARIAGLLASKRTPELLPLCHPVRTTSAQIDFELDVERGELRVTATVEAFDRTGVEMEAMVAAGVAALTAYDMLKSADRWATIGPVRLEAKSGGKSGRVTRPAERGGEGDG